MGIGSGLGAQIGFAEESTYGTPVTVTRFLEFNNESVKTELAQVTSMGLGRGRFQRTGRQKTVIKGASGSVEFDLMTKGFGMVLKHCLGGYANTSIAGSERKALITPDANGLAGLSLTTQIGRPSIDGTCRPFTYEGCKVASWELKNAVDDKVVLIVNLDAETVGTATGLATPSYASGAEIFAFSECAATLNGASIAIREFSIKGENGLATDRRRLGNTKGEPIAAAFAKISGTLDFEFEDLARYGQMVAGTEVANLILTFTTPTVISGGGPALFKITIPLLVFSGESPNASGPEIIREPMTFIAIDDGTNPVITLEQRTTDTAA